MAKVDYVNLPCPVAFEQLKRECFESLKSETIQGARVDYTQAINPRFWLNHSVFMGCRDVPSKHFRDLKVPISYYEFGVNSMDPKLMFFGRLLTDQTADFRLSSNLTENFTFKANGQYSTELHVSHVMGSIEYKGEDYRSQFQLGSGSLVGANYIQSVSPHLSLGGEAFWAGQDQISGIGFAARYNTDKMVATSQVTSTGKISMSYVQKIRESFLASDFIYNYISGDFKASFGFDYKHNEQFDFGWLDSWSSRANLSISAVVSALLHRSRLKGKIDSNGCVTAFLDRRLDEGLNLTLSGEVDFKRRDCKFGFGLVVGE